MNQTMSEQNATAEPKVPGRTFGFIFMLVATLFVAFHLQQQSPGMEENLAGMAEQSTATLDSIAGFDEAFWFLPSEDNLGFVEIPAGPFIMGSNPGLDRMAYANERWSDLRRQGEVDLPAFMISRYETTIAQFSAYLEDTGLSAPGVALDGDPRLPVRNLTWTQAIAYTRWLDDKLRNAGATPEPVRAMLQAGAQLTLPNEAEWEKAARGTEGGVFPWRNIPADSVANFNNDEPRPVNAVSCSQCAWGLNDMAGNVWEMTRSILQDYPFDPQDDGANLVEDPLFTMRGGSFSDGLANIRTAVRGGVDPGTSSPIIGFRVAISTQ